MFLRSSRDGELARTLTWRRIIGAGGNQPGETQVGLSSIKYVSPTWYGFTAAATLVADDFWDVSLRYRDTAIQPTSTCPFPIRQATPPCSSTLTASSRCITASSTR